jgi:hypothetical protein
MKSNLLTQFAMSAALVTASFVATPFVLASDHEHSDAMPMAGSDDHAAFDLAKAKASYPLETCVVSGEKLGGDMGGPVDFVYQVAGQPDRLVRFCCKGCLKDFKKDPATFLKKIDAASAAKARPTAGKS